MYTEQAPVDKVPDSRHVKGSTLRIYIIHKQSNKQRGKVEIICNKKEEVIR